MARQYGQVPPRCPSCGSLRLLSPSSFDPAQRWACLDCGYRFIETSSRYRPSPWPPEKDDR